MKRLIALLLIFTFFQFSLIKADDKGYQIPNGYRLVEVVEQDYNVVNPEINIDGKGYVAYSSGWEIRNFRVDSYQIYYPEDPVVSDYFDDPANFIETYSATGTATFNFSSGIDVSIAEAKVGFTSSYSETFKKEYQVKADENEIVNVSVFINYKQWRFDAYYNNEFKGTEFIHKPIGLKFVQKRYRK